MVVQMIIDTGIATITRTYRDIIKGVNLAQMREGFYAQEQSAKSGQMYQLKGKERILVAQFGIANNSDQGRFDEGSTDWPEEGKDL